MTHPLYSPDLAISDFWLFPKLESPLKGKRFQTVHEIQENTTGSWWWLGEVCEVPRCLLWRGLRHHCLVYNVSCILYLLQSLSLFFILHGWISSGQASYNGKMLFLKFQICFLIRHLFNPIFSSFFLYCFIYWGDFILIQLFLSHSWVVVHTKMWQLWSWSGMWFWISVTD